LFVLAADTTIAIVAKPIPDCGEAHLSVPEESAREDFNLSPPLVTKTQSAEYEDESAASKYTDIEPPFCGRAPGTMALTPICATY
jgi:hypothetical protein